MHVCMREDVWKGTLVFSHVLPHAHMTSVSYLTGCVCVCEGECVEGYADLSTSPPSYTHAILSGLLIRVDWAISMCLPCLSAIYFVQGHCGHWGHCLEGLMWPLGVCSMG